VRALFDDAAFVENEDRVDVLEDARALRDDK
jgi:hypothetical protein